jgi:tetratricopeptide (TPR) repeat protein
VRTYESRPGPYDRIEEPDLARARDARAALERGDARTAQSILTGLFERLPEHVPVGAMLQDVQLELFASLPEAARAESERELAERHRARAEREPQPAWLVLAARVEPDRLAAVRLLERALEIDADCVWAHYGLAHVHARAGDFSEARESVEDALALDPGHMQTRRLEINLLARAGESDRAIPALEAWLADAVDEEGRANPFLGPAAVASARIDLATLRVVAGEPAEALLELERAGAGDRPGTLPPEERVRAALVGAASHFALGRPDLALALAGRAAEASPEGALPLVQQALIFEYEKGDLEGARVAWEAAAERLTATGAREGGDLSFLLLLVQARVHAERLAAKAIEAGR